MNARQRYVYFVATATGPIKIGVAFDVPTRVSNLQTALPDKLNLLGFVPGDEILEKTLHTELSAHHLRGEWFKGNAAVYSVVHRELAKSPVIIPRARKFKDPRSKFDAWRIARGLSQQGACNLLDLSKGHGSMLCSGRAPISRNLAVRMSTISGEPWWSFIDTTMKRIPNGLAQAAA